MKVTVSGHHYDVTDGTRRHIEEAAAKLERFYNPIVEAVVTLTQEANVVRADVVVRVHGHTLKSTGEDAKVSPSIDTAMDKMARQLKRLHDKQRRPRPAAAPDTEE